MQLYLCARSRTRTQWLGTRSLSFSVYRRAESSTAALEAQPISPSRSQDDEQTNDRAYEISRSHRLRHGGRGSLPLPPAMNPEYQEAVGRHKRKKKDPLKNNVSPLQMKLASNPYGMRVGPSYTVSFTKLYQLMPLQALSADVHSRIPYCRRTSCKRSPQSSRRSVSHLQLRRTRNHQQMPSRKTTITAQPLRPKQIL